MGVARRRRYPDTRAHHGPSKEGHGGLLAGWRERMVQLGREMDKTPSRMAEMVEGAANTLKRAVESTADAISESMDEVMSTLVPPTTEDPGPRSRRKSIAQERSDSHAETENLEGTAEQIEGREEVVDGDGAPAEAVMPGDDEMRKDHWSVAAVDLGNPNETNPSPDPVDLGARRANSRGVPLCLAAERDEKREGSGPQTEDRRESQREAGVSGSNTWTRHPSVPPLRLHTLRAAERGTSWDFGF
eukprot:TRINITY_DN564_c0_g1_i4.p1 TRINITY_DN564_c0_g1~~TRINITY_DN564_c0_g1_i4.p1  ORF type:complete len:245 (-),score=45.34 TRINITY_DN564_c0_g1_i4:50-784(-)